MKKSVVFDALLTEARCATSFPSLDDVTVFYTVLHLRSVAQLLFDTYSTHSAEYLILDSYCVCGPRSSFIGPLCEVH